MSTNSDGLRAMHCAFAVLNDFDLSKESIISEIRKCIVVFANDRHFLDTITFVLHIGIASYLSDISIAFVIATYG